MNRNQPALEIQEWGNSIGGQSRTEGEPLEVRSPFDGAHVATAFWADKDDVEKAVEATCEAFATVAALPTYERAAILRRMADRVEARGDELTRWLALEAGKPVKAGRVEVERAVFTLRDFAEEVRRIEHEFMPLDVVPAARGRWAIVKRVPIGPVLAITPFNFPVNLVCHKVGPALAAGDPVLQKPSPRTPITSLLLAQVAAEAGVPAGVLNVLNCSNELTAQLAADDRFKLLTFTGSDAVGWALKAKAGKKRVALELGGIAGAIVDVDADIEYAAGRCTAGGFGYAGQSCISVQRIFVHSSVLEKFQTELVERASALKTGDPLDEATDIGPMITEEAAQRVESWVAEAVQGGAKVLTGGKREGPMFAPTVLTGAAPDMKVRCEEMFGPVVTLESFDDFDRTLAAVNDTPYGLQAGVFTRDVKKIFRAFDTLEVGGVIANDVPTFRVDHMPYGGVKDSGAGREGSRYALEEMTERRTLVLNLEG